jgi:hypothetical protein
VQHGTGRTVGLVVTDNASTMLSYRPGSATHAPSLRLHRMFLHADDTVVAALCEWLRPASRRTAGRVVDAFIRDHRHLVRPKPRRIPLRTRGEVHDLEALYDEVNAAEFGKAVTAAITWGRRAGGRRRRSIRFGSYAEREHLIRIHPALDQAFVPAHFVRYIVFHEMLHAFMGIGETASGRRRIHPPAFKQRERQYPGYEKAVAWQENPRNLRRLLRSR